MIKNNFLKSVAFISCLAFPAGVNAASDNKEPVSIHPEAMVVAAQDLLTVCVSEVGVNIALANAAMEHFVSKARRDVQRALETCSKKHKDEHVKSIVSVAGAAISYLNIDSPQEALDIANNSERDIFGLMSPKIIKSLQDNCADSSYSFECVSEFAPQISYKVNIEELGWASINNNGRILTTVKEIEEKERATAKDEASQTLRDLKNAYYTASRNGVTFEDNENILPKIANYLPATFQKVEDGTVVIPNMGSQKGILKSTGRSWKFEFTATLDECRDVVESYLSLGVASIKNSGRNVPLTLASAKNYCGPTDENLLEVFF